MELLLRDCVDVDGIASAGWGRTTFAINQSEARSDAQLVKKYVRRTTQLSCSQRWCQSLLIPQYGCGVGV